MLIDFTSTNVRAKLVFIIKMALSYVLFGSTRIRRWRRGADQDEDAGEGIERMSGAFDVINKFLSRPSHVHGANN